MKIFLETYDERYIDRIRFLFRIKPVLENDFGYTFVEHEKDAELIISQQVSYSPNLDLCLSTRKDVIILEVNDTASIFNDSLRQIIGRENLKGFFKDTNFKDKSVHNLPTSGDRRYHVNFINDFANVCEKDEYDIKIKEKDLGKIKCAMPSFLNFRMDQMRNSGDFLEREDRPFVLNFAGTTDYFKNKNYVNLQKDDKRLNLPLLMKIHRDRAIEEIKNYAVKKNCNVILSNSKPMTQIEYWHSLLASRICVSPWGFGAYNWRDYEAIYLGAVLLKPNTDFLETYCDLFRSSMFYVDCRPDFSDLSEKVDFIESNFQSCKEMRKRALNLLNDNDDTHKIAKRFDKQIREALEGK